MKNKGINVSRARELFGKETSLQRFIFKHKKEYETLTDYEIEVLTVIAASDSHNMAVKAMGITGEAFLQHRLRIQQKLSIDHETDFLKYALAFGLIPF